MVSMNMEVGGPLNDLLELLNQIKTELVALGETAEDEYTSSKRRCDLDQAQLTTTLAQSQDDLASYKGEQSNLSDELSGMEQRVKDGI